MNSGRPVADPSGLLHPVESDVEKQRADDSSNAVGNFCFDVTLSYRRLERPRRVRKEA